MGDERRLLDLAHEMWHTDRHRMNFETSFGTLAWEGPAVGRARLFERDGHLVAWARLTPGYDRIRRVGERDTAPPNLVWMVDWRDPDADELLISIIDWAESRSDAPFTTSHAIADDVARAILVSRGYAPDPREPFGIYLQLGLPAASHQPVDGYTLTTMAELGDVELRAAAHRVAWDGSTRTAADVGRTMSQWPYRADLDVVALTDSGEPVGSALAWYDRAYDYGEFEPVGVGPDHRGRGLARSMLRFGLERLSEAGASHAVVGARGDDDYPIPRQVYGSVGFQRFATQQIVRRP
ncbi:MAG: GNAT family N-acetyltransferase [Actinomycetota bacterium]|nr:GNAT family N-acetyltransferase [Actinomycetota bacterium]